MNKNKSSTNKSGKANNNVIKLPISGDTVTFKEKMDASTFIKVKRVFTYMKASSDITPENCPTDIDFFTDLAVKLVNKEGEEIPVSKEYLETLEIEDVVMIDDKCRDMLSYEQKKITI